MSKLKELIAELCPNGVEYKELKEVLTIKNGSDYKNFLEGEIPVYGSGGIMTYIDRYAYDKPSVLIPRKGSIDKLYYVEVPFWNVDTIFYTEINETIINPRYVYHVLRKEHLEKYNTAGGVPSLTQKVLNKVKIPVPPLPVQEEIVRILDSFTSLTAELQAELQARQKQYEYYRDQLLTFDVHGGGASEVQWKTLGEACNMKAGRSISSSKISSVCDSNYRYACYGGNGLRGYVELQSHKGEFPIIGRQGALCGNVNYASGEFYATEHAVVVESKGKYLQRFLYHLLISMNLNQYKSQGAQPGLSVKRLEELIVPIPSMEIQERIVNVLDNFDAICSDLNIGLPAEIEARQKQYEYYRDALLSFNCSHSVNVERERERELNKLLQYVFGYTTLTIGEIGRISMCKRIMKAETSTHGDVPFFKIGTFGKQPDAYITQEKFDEYRKTYSFPKKGDVLISAAGTIGRTVIYNGEPAYYQDSNIVWVDNDESIVLNKYLYYFYQTSPWVASTGGTIARLYNDNISKTKIKVPTLEQQKKIVSILDRFETLCNDMTAGLPAEIEARQKQYEYYRDRLLSFPKLT